MKTILSGISGIPAENIEYAKVSFHQTDLARRF